MMKPFQKQAFHWFHRFPNKATLLSIILNPFCKNLHSIWIGTILQFPLKALRDHNAIQIHKMIVVCILCYLLLCSNLPFKFVSMLLLNTKACLPKLTHYSISLKWYCTHSNHPWVLLICNFNIITNKTHTNQFITTPKLGIKYGVPINDIY